MERLDRLEDKMDRVSESVIRLEEQAKATFALLQAHDAKGARALEKAEVLEDRLDGVEAMWHVPYKWAKIIAAILGAITAVYTAWKLLGR